MLDEETIPPLYWNHVWWIPHPQQGVCHQVDKIGPIKSNMYGDIEVQACGKCLGYRIYLMKDGERIAVNWQYVESLETDLHHRILRYLGWKDCQSE